MSGSAQQQAKDGNRLEFLVHRSASKEDVKKAFESHFDVKVEKVNTRILKDGKHAIIKLKKEFSAEEIGMRIGIF
jgi:large subunit ribosomal protein L23